MFAHCKNKYLWLITQMRWKSVFLTFLLLASFAKAQVITKSFGTGANSFTMDFVTVSNPGNRADTAGSPNPVGAVDYVYNIGRYEVSHDMVIKATAAGSLGIGMQDMTFWTTAAANGLNRPATGITWLEAATFVNWLNTSSGYSAAYKFGSDGLFRLWLPSDPGYNSRNQFRNSNANYFIPNVDEWYKAAFYDPNKNGGSGGYWKYSTGSDAEPTPVENGSFQGTMVYKGQYAPADINDAGGFSPYGTMAQGGNVKEWIETAADGLNDVPGEDKGSRGGAWGSNAADVAATAYGGAWQTWDWPDQGFRVAMIPEPSTFSLLTAIMGGLVAFRRRK